MKKYLLISFLCISTLALSFGVQAKFVEVIDKWNGAGLVQYKNMDYSFSKELRNDSFLTITKRVKNILEYENDLKMQLESELKKVINGKASLKSFNFNINGELEIKLTGLSNGKVEIKLGNISISSSARVKKGLFAKGKIDITTNKLTLTGEYNPITGKVFNLQPNSDFNVDVDVDVDSVLDLLLPGFNFLFTNKMEDDLGQQFEDKIRESLNSRANGYEDVLFGLDRHLPKNKYVFNGLDLAEEIESSFKNLISNESITVKVYSKNKIMRNNNNVTLGNIEINISNHLLLHIYETVSTRDIWDDECNRITCQVEP